MPLLRALIGAVLVSGAVSCASVGMPRCGAGEQAAVADLVYFGANKPNGVVSPEEWANFLRVVVTPRFPAGLSVWQASGQWLGADGTLTKENSFVLSLIHPEEPAVEEAVKAVISEYKARYQQEAVLRVKSTACMSL